MNIDRKKTSTKANAVFDLNIDENKSLLEQLFIDGNERASQVETWLRLLAVGDIHGNFAKLIDVIKKARFSSNDYIIFLGDYTDRGDDNKNCMKLVVEWFNQPNIVFLMGNHEQLFLEHFIRCARQVENNLSINNLDIDAISNKNFKKIFLIMLKYSSAFLLNQGNKTLNEINISSDSDLQLLRAYLKAILKMNISYLLPVNENEYLFTHAGINPKFSLDQQRKEDLLWIRSDFYNHYSGNTTIVVGHTPTLLINSDTKPIINNERNIIMLDTGSFHRLGRITIMNIINKKYYQSFNDLEYSLTKDTISNVKFLNKE